jgi:hypothetical protein
VLQNPSKVGYAAKPPKSGTPNTTLIERINVRHRSVAITLNLILLFASLVAIHDSIAVTTESSPGFRMYLLVRRGVITIDEENAREVDPRFTRPIGHTDLARWIAGRYIVAERVLGILGALVSASNLVIIRQNGPRYVDA